MLVKSHSLKYLEDFGLRIGDELYFYDKCTFGDDWGENMGPVKVSSKLPTSPVIRVNAVWMTKPLKIRCHIADTEDKKRRGLQGFEQLEMHEGMYFPYSPYGEHVTFHQGSVSFGLDLIFLRDNQIAKIEADTKVGSCDRWSCDSCSGVIEVNAGFCFENDVNVGDKVALFSVSERDINSLEVEASEEYDDLYDSYSDDNYYYMPNSVNLISAIADGL